MKNTGFVLIAVTLILSGCFGDPHKSYLGLWQRQDINLEQVLEITQDGDTYFLDENILQDTDMFGRKKSPMTLTKNDDYLSASNGLGPLPLGLSDDQKTLHLSDRSYRKISAEQLEGVKAGIEKKSAEHEKNREACKSLNADYLQQRSQISTDVSDAREQVKQRKALEDQFKPKSNAIPHCVLGFSW